MPKKEIKIPRSRTKADEAEWWDSHPEVATEIMKCSIKSGNARRAVPLKTVTMQLRVPKRSKKRAVPPDQLVT